MDLRAPPPLDRPMRLEIEADATRLCLGEQLIAQARREPLELELPTPPSLDEAHALSKHYIGFETHLLETCFVCGTKRAEHDGLEIFAGRREPDAPVAAPWTPAADLGDAEGLVEARYLWAALDCPGYFGGLAKAELALLARMTARVARRPPVEEPLVVMGWSRGREGRKIHAGTAIFDAAGEALAWSQQLWVAVDRLPDGAS